MRQDGEAHTIARPSRPRTWPSERIAPVGPRLRSAEPSGQGTGSLEAAARAALYEVPPWGTAISGTCSCAALHPPCSTELLVEGDLRL